MQPHTSHAFRVRWRTLKSLSSQVQAQNQPIHRRTLALGYRGSPNSARRTSRPIHGYVIGARRRPGGGDVTGGAPRLPRAGPRRAPMTPGELGRPGRWAGPGVSARTGACSHPPCRRRRRSRRASGAHADRGRRTCGPGEIVCLCLGETRAWASLPRPPGALGTPDQVAARTPASRPSPAPRPTGGMHGVPRGATAWACAPRFSWATAWAPCALPPGAG